MTAIFQDGGQADKFRRKMFRQSLRIAMLAIQKLKRIANRTIFDRDMVDERFRNTEIVSVTTNIFQDGGQTNKFRRKMFRQSLRTVMLSIQKLKRIANRTIFHRDMVDERSRNREIVSVMTTIFQDGGQTNKFRRKMFRQSLRIVMLAIQKLKRIANRTIFDRDKVDQKFLNTEIVR